MTDLQVIIKCHKLHIIKFNFENNFYNRIEPPNFYNYFGKALNKESDCIVDTFGESCEVFIFGLGVLIMKLVLDTIQLHFCKSVSCSFCACCYCCGFLAPP
jgi:hypothetical protein